MHEGVAEEEDRWTFVRAAIARAVRVVVDERARALGDAAVDLGGVLALARPPQIVRGRRARPEPEQADEQQEGREATRAPGPRAGHAGRTASCAKHGRAAVGGGSRAARSLVVGLNVRPGFARGRGIFSGNGSAVGVFFFPARTRSTSPLHQSQAVFASLVEKIMKSVVGKIDRGDRSRQSVLIGETGR